MVAIIDCGLGNLGSIANMLDVIGVRSTITDSEKEIDSADHIILPGVGSFDTGMSNLQIKGLDEVIKNQAIAGKPILGICLGMQLLGRGSEEGALPGLGLIPFDNVKFSFEQDSNLKIPHMGWNVVEFKKDIPLLEGIDGRQRYYFVHSYHAVCDRDENVMMTCDYGYNFAAAVCKDNVYGVQFHPEKSHSFGMKIFDNFVNRC